MRLSEAIRLGAMLKPQAFDFGKPGSLCALEGAAIAIGKRKHQWASLDDDWPWICAITNVACPACGLKDDCVETAIAHLNDSHHWTREQIADWLERTFEQPVASVAADRPASQLV